MSTATVPTKYRVSIPGSIAEECAYCHGSGCMPESRVPCHVCRGGGKVQVIQPSTRCPKCVGVGRIHQGSRSQARCLTCLGTGWLKTDVHLAYGLSEAQDSNVP